MSVSVQGKIYLNIILFATLNYRFASDISTIKLNINDLLPFYAILRSIPNKLNIPNGLSKFYYMLESL